MSGGAAAPNSGAAGTPADADAAVVEAGLELLEGMGFRDRPLNARLLRQHGHNVQRVVEELVAAAAHMPAAVAVRAPCTRGPREGEPWSQRGGEPPTCCACSRWWVAHEHAQRTRTGPRLAAAFIAGCNVKPLPIPCTHVRECVRACVRTCFHVRVTA